MSLRLEMLQVARQAPKVLGDSADLVHGFFQRQQNPDGGFKDRAGESDLYYTVFGLEGLQALRASIPTGRIERYLSQFGEGDHLDFIHLCCLIRCWAALGKAEEQLSQKRVLDRLEQYRTDDGGYNPTSSHGHGTAYGAFLAVGAYTDLDRQVPNPRKVAQSLKALEVPDGAWVNDPTMETGSTNATAAAATVLRNLQLPISATVAEWLLARAHPQGGFLATPKAPMPDLLSTATALHALGGLNAPIDSVKEACLDFIDTLWTNEGGFHGYWADETLDCEYTFYGLLALGHLSFP